MTAENGLAGWLCGGRGYTIGGTTAENGLAEWFGGCCRTIVGGTRNGLAAGRIGCGFEIAGFGSSDDGDCVVVWCDGGAGVGVYCCVGGGVWGFDNGGDGIDGSDDRACGGAGDLFIGGATEGCDGGDE